jgi:hypothetical protein
MKRMTWLLIGLVFLGCLSFYCLRSNEKLVVHENVKESNQGDTVPKNEDAGNAYSGLRTMALNTTPVQLQLTIPENQTKVYGILMDWDLGEGIATVICYSTGDASIYLSSGGGMIGAGHHEIVNREAKKLLENAQNYLSKTVQTELTPLPKKNWVNFYFLTNKGKYFAEETIENFNNHSSVWLPIFEGFNTIITESRNLNTNKQ